MSEYEPTRHTAIITGMIILTGTVRILIRTGITPRAIIRAKMFARKSDAIKPHAKSGSFVNRSGPGLRPHIMSPPRRTAPVPEPGIPRARRGANAPAAAALFAASQAAMPSIAPVPSGSSFLKPLCIA